jgi:hypothetical protein
VAAVVARVGGVDFPGRLRKIVFRPAPLSVLRDMMETEWR